MSSNIVTIEMEALSENQSLARGMVANYMALFDPTVDELVEVKTAVSEAVSNSIIHGYKNKQEGKIKIEISTLNKSTVSIKIIDLGCGMDNIKKAMEPMFSTMKDDELSGMGFTVMESFMDKMHVESEVDKGTVVTLIKKIDNDYGF